MQSSLAPLRILILFLVVTLGASVFHTQVLRVTSKHYNDELVSDKSPPANGKHPSQHMVNLHLNAQRPGEMSDRIKRNSDQDHHMEKRAPQNPADIALGIKLGAGAVKVKVASLGAEALIKGSLLLGAQNLKTGAIGGLIQGAKGLKTVFMGAKFVKKGLALSMRPIKKPLELMNIFGKKLMKCCWWLTG